MLYHGTRGGGKTDSLLMDFLQHVGTGLKDEWRGILFRRTYPELEDVRAKSKKWFPRIFPDAKFNEAKNFWEFRDGERLYFRHFSREDDYNKYHGHQYPFIAWEELTTWPDAGGYLRMMSLCRSPNPDVPKKYRATTNPYGPGHNWVKSRFRLQGPTPPGPGPTLPIFGEDEKWMHNAVAIGSSIKENKILLDADPTYIDKIKASARNPAELGAWLNNDWSIVAGGMFDDVWDPEVHIVFPFRVPPSWHINRSLDWGSSRPFSVGWWAESDGSDYRDNEGVLHSTVQGDLFRIMEWYGWTGKPNEGLRLLASEVTRGIIRREQEAGIYGRVDPGPADASIYNIEDGHSIAASFAETVVINGKEYDGITWVPADKSKGSREQGWQMIRERMENSKTVTRDGRKAPRVRPGIFVTTSCGDGFIRTVPVLPRDDARPDDVDTRTEDHVGDETRYRVRRDTRSGSVRWGVRGLY